MKTIFSTYFSLMPDTVTGSDCSERIKFATLGKKGGGGEQRLIKVLESEKALQM